MATGEADTITRATYTRSLNTATNLRSAPVRLVSQRSAVRSPPSPYHGYSHTLRGRRSVRAARRSLYTSQWAPMPTALPGGPLPSQARREARAGDQAARVHHDTPQLGGGLLAERRPVVRRRGTEQQGAADELRLAGADGTRRQARRRRGEWIVGGKYGKIR